MVSHLARGGMAIVRPSQGAPVAAVELWYRAPSTGFGGKAQPSIARLAAQAVAASKPILGDPLGKVVRDAGGRLAITVYTDSIEISALVSVCECADGRQGDDDCLLCAGNDRRRLSLRAA